MRCEILRTKASPAAWLEGDAVKKIFLKTSYPRFVGSWMRCRQARFLEVHDVLAASRRGPDEDHPPEDRRPVLHHLKRDHPAERVPEDIAPADSECLEKGHGVPRHCRDRRRYLPAGAADAGVVEQDDLSSSRERIGHRWIPVVERSGEVLQEEQWQPRAVAESPVRVRMVIHLEKLRRRARITRGLGR